MYDQFFRQHKIAPHMRKEFVSLWSGWLGSVRIHELDEVTENEWSRFNDFVSLVATEYEAFLPNHEERELIPVEKPGTLAQSYSHAMNKSASDFLQLVVPVLDCVIEESWDYTYIIWHQGDESISELSPLIGRVGLFHFSS